MTASQIAGLPRKFRSDVFRTIFKAGVAQGFHQGFFRGSGHAYLTCPQCGERVVFSLTSNSSNSSKIRNAIADLRRHGFLWEGRPAEHTAPLDGRRAA